MHRSDPARHREQAISGPASALDLSLETVQRCVDKLDAAGIIARRGGRYEPVQAATVDTRAIGKLREHWAGVSSERVRAPRSDDVFSYDVLSALRADVDRIDCPATRNVRRDPHDCPNTSEGEVTAGVSLQLGRWGSRE